MKIAIIGGSGFIGSRLTRRLLDAGHDVVIIDKKPSSEYGSLWKFGDVRRQDSLIGPLEGVEVLYNLAAEHSDVVEPVNLYYDVNVEGARNVSKAAGTAGVNRIIFTSSVAVYGKASINTDESGALDPSNHYGSSKMLAEEVYRTWLFDDSENSLVIVRPTVVFGENNRGNVYNLMRQIAGKRFAMIGSGKNKKSMAYVENVAAFLEYVLIFDKGEKVFNYVDNPDLDMNQLVSHINKKLGREKSSVVRIPYIIGLTGGYFFDLISFITKKKFPVNSVRIRKFVSDTLFSSSKLNELYFRPPVSMEEGLNLTIQHEFQSAGD